MAMGQLDWGFVSALLELTPNKVMAVDVDGSFLVDEGAIGAYDFIHLHITETGKVPARAVVAERFAVLQSPDAARDQVAVEWVVRELRKRKTFALVQQGLSNAVGELKAQSPDSALEVIDRMIRDVEAVRQKVKIHDLQQIGPQLIQLYEDIKSGKMGVEFPWRSLNMMTRGMWPETVTFFAARPGTGKCVAAGTEIPDPVTGVYRFVEDVVADVSSMVFTRDKARTVSSTVPSGRWATGTKECLRIVTRSGLELVVTPEHPLSTVDGWRRADELVEGEHVETVKWMPEPIEANDVASETHVDLVAGLLAEGGCTKDPPKFSNEDPEIVDRVRQATEMLGAKMVQYKGMKSYEYSLTSGERGHANQEGGMNPVRMLMGMWGLGHEKSVDKIVPPKVFSLSNRLLARFIGMFWSCDGSVEGDNRLSLTLGSERMVRQFKRLLLRFGITSRVAYKPVKYNGGILDSWRLTVHSTCHRLFREQIPLVGEKVFLLRDLPDGWSPNVDNVPMTASLESKIFGALDRGRKRGVPLLALRDALGWTCSLDRRKLVKRKTISKRVLSTLAKIFDASELASLCLSHWDEVVRIEEAGERQVYDLTVPTTHNFVANDIVAHNTFVVIICARHAHLNDHRVLIVSPEMNSLEMGERFFAIEGGVAYSDVISGSLGQVAGPDGISAEQRYVTAINSQIGPGPGPWIVDDEDRLTAPALEATIAALQPDLLAVDAAYLLRIGKGSRYERIIEIVEWLRYVAKKFHIAVAATSQLTKEAEKKGVVGQLTVALTDTINWDAHNLFALKQTPEMREDNKLAIHPVKVRRLARAYGKNSVDINWDMERMDFDEVEERDEFKDGGSSDPYAKKGSRGDDDMPF